jgi:type VI secretion system Hcp family effector
MAFNAYLLFKPGKGNDEINGESTSLPESSAVAKKAIEVTDFGFGVSMPVTTSRSDGGGATVGRANFDVFTCNKNIDTATCKLVEYCCKGTAIEKAVLHLYRQGVGAEASGVVKYVMVTFKFVVITKVGISGGGEELPKESLEFNYGACEYMYQETDHEFGTATKRATDKAGWTTIENKTVAGLQGFNDFIPG